MIPWWSSWSACYCLARVSLVGCLVDCCSASGLPHGSMSQPKTKSQSTSQPTNQLSRQSLSLVLMYNKTSIQQTSQKITHPTHTSTNRQAHELRPTPPTTQRNEQSSNQSIKTLTNQAANHPTNWTILVYVRPLYKFRVHQACTDCWQVLRMS